MLNFLSRVFGNKNVPRPHHEVLMEDAEKTGDDTRLIAEMIVQWSWDTHDKRPFIAPAAEFVTNLAEAGYKPISQLSAEENEEMPPQKRLICKALDGIQKTGFLDAHMGQALHHFSETGQVDQSYGSYGLHISPP